MFHPKGIQHAYKLGRLILKENNFDSGLCAFGVTTIDKNPDFQWEGTGACHAGYNRIAKKLGAKAHFIVDVLYPTMLSFSIRMKWYEYILKRSVYAPMFAEENVINGYRRGYFIYTTDIDANLLTAGSVAIRQASEHPDIVENWYHLVEAGCQEDIAYVMSFATTIHTGNLSLIRKGTIGHVPVEPSTMNTTNLLAFFNKEIVNPMEIYRERKGYSGFNHMFGEKFNNGVSITKVIYKRWLAVNEADMPEVPKRRKALFNLFWNHIEDDENVFNIIPTKYAYPRLAKILNNYREEVLANA